MRDSREERIQGPRGGDSIWLKCRRKEALLRTPYRSRAFFDCEAYIREDLITYLVSACFTSLTSAAGDTWFHSHTITRFDVAHSAADFGINKQLLSMLTV